MLVRIPAEPMADGVVMNGQLSENFSGMGFECDQELFEKSFVKDSARGSGPFLTYAALAGERKARQNHGVELILRAFLHGNAIGNSVRLVIVRDDGINFCIEIALMSVLVAGAVPA